MVAHVEAGLEHDTRLDVHRRSAGAILAYGLCTMSAVARTLPYSCAVSPSPGAHPCGGSRLGLSAPADVAPLSQDVTWSRRDGLSLLELYRLTRERRFTRRLSMPLPMNGVFLTPGRELARFTRRYAATPSHAWRRAVYVGLVSWCTRGGARRLQTAPLNTLRCVRTLTMPCTARWLKDLATIIFVSRRPGMWSLCSRLGYGSDDPGRLVEVQHSPVRFGEYCDTWLGGAGYPGGRDSGTHDRLIRHWLWSATARQATMRPLRAHTGYAPAGRGNTNPSACQLQERSASLS